ncbi:hypothetical protein R3P38DRAFT_2777008 [Favolaschia claudopus]|uniref:Uncharacterized protein n=1 Tax=Favolaschia claudopus TaxID=2862362 RepID=A0AAW0BMM5_9AGAR
MTSTGGDLPTDSRHVPCQEVVLAKDYSASSLASSSSVSLSNDPSRCLSPHADPSPAATHNLPFLHPILAHARRPSSSRDCDTLEAKPAPLFSVDNTPIPLPRTPFSIPETVFLATFSYHTHTQTTTTTASHGKLDSGAENRFMIPSAYFDRRSPPLPSPFIWVGWAACAAGTISPHCTRLRRLLAPHILLASTREMTRALIESKAHAEVLLALRSLRASPPFHASAASDERVRAGSAFHGSFITYIEEAIVWQCAGSLKYYEISATWRAAAPHGLHGGGDQVG